MYTFLKYLFIWLHPVLVVAGGLLSCGRKAPLLRLAGSFSCGRDRTRAPCIGSAESSLLRHQGSPYSEIILTKYVQYL